MRAGILFLPFLVLFAAPSASAAYSAPLFDTHAHLDEDGVSSALARNMPAFGVERTLVFAEMRPDDIDDSWDALRDELGEHPGRFVAFFHVSPQAPSDADASRLARVTEAHPDVFRGVGEFGLYRAPWVGRSLAEDPWPGVFRFAAENGLVLMLHPLPEQYDDLARLLDANPETRVLVHGFESPGRMPAMLRDHPNLHVTVDAAGMLVSRGPGPGTPLMYAPGGKEAFLAAFDRDRAALLDAAVETWAPVVAAAPDRAMWGTDVAFGWHAEEDVYSRLVGFSRDFIDRLPEEQREPYARGNGLRLLGAEAAQIPRPEDGVPAASPALALLVVGALALARRGMR